jgi:hypothetical protein
MRTLKRALQELSEEGMGWSHLDIHNLILELTGNDPERLNLMLLDLDKLMGHESYKLDLQDIKEKRDGIEPEYLELVDRHKYFIFMTRVRQAIRAKLNLDFMNRVHENRINWLRDDLANRAFIEALSKYGYISNKDYFKVCGNFIGMLSDEKTERIDWLRSQRLLIRMNGYLINEGIIGSTDQLWLMVANSYSWKGANFKTDSLKSDNSYMHESKHVVTGWSKLKELLVDTLQSFT